MSRDFVCWMSIDRASDLVRLGAQGAFSDAHSGATGLVEEFKRRFGSVPAFVARAPGRVNVIGMMHSFCGQTRS
jgi:hypothetical protein